MIKSQRISEKLYELMRDEDAMPQDIYDVMSEVWQAVARDYKTAGEYQIEQHRKKSQ